MIFSQVLLRRVSGIVVTGAFSTFIYYFFFKWPSEDQELQDYLKWKYG